MRAYYNEIDPYCVSRLRQRIADGRIMEGDVDDRDIRDVRGEDLAGYTRCHFFAGIAGWDLALQLAGWPADRPVWTGSCPCPPFSCAGKKKRCPECEGRNLVPHVFRTGVFVCCDCGHEWDADARHLWPEFRRLIDECLPECVLGEQVASPDGLVWLAGVHATLAVLGYAVRRTDLPAACVGAPHIRPRLWWMADSERKRTRSGEPTGEDVAGQRGRGPAIGCPAGGLADSDDWKRRQSRRQPRGPITAANRTVVGGLADEFGPGLEGGQEQPAQQECQAVERSGGTGGLVHAAGKRAEPVEQPGQRAGDVAAGPWNEYAVVWCDERAFGKGWVPRRVPESAFQFVGDGLPSRLAEDGYPLAVGVKDRAKMLRAIGNAIVPQVAAEFIRMCNVLTLRPLRALRASVVGNCSSDGCKMTIHSVECKERPRGASTPGAVTRNLVGRYE